MTAPEQPTPETTTATGSKPVLVKKYANRRLYNTESSSYITLDNLAEMIRQGRDFVVCDAKTGEDITRSVLTQIIVEEENKVGRAMLPISFLRQLIGFYGDSLQGVVPRYLEQSMATFARQQQQMRSAVQQTMDSFLPPGFEEMGRQNMAMLDRAMSLFTPFYRGNEATPDQETAHSPRPSHEDFVDLQQQKVAQLLAELEQLRAELASARTESAPPQPPPADPT